ncbi:class 3 adenylate cyclase [Methylohalomonas lacus]|uniref:Adenylate cyclase n=1 Tax=Methylohalomonas lacus TaxID=398773 RepID=A0AAE3HKR7_9GAMM|nr:adenylate/guanylate cyclase domain-containing protein [Methylohalomonas lacus]MCS3902941.1 class 3 adenylate cyclase [Methylohalomonas lacus]
MLIIKYPINIWESISANGLDTFDTDIKRSIILVNQIAFCGLITSLVYNILYALYDLHLLFPAISINIIGMIFFAGILLLNKLHKHNAAKWTLVLAPNLQIFALTYYLGTASGMQLLHIMMASFPLLLAINDRIYIRAIFVIIPILFYILSYFSFSSGKNLIALDTLFLSTLFMTVSISVFALVILFLHLFHVEVKRAERLQSLEYDRAESLLLNILPADVARQLKDDAKVIAERHDSVSVLFCDIVGFTRISDQLAPEQIISILNDFFSYLDRLAEHYGLEKIKTIGDSYMIAGGIPVPDSQHARNIANFALDAQDYMEQIHIGRNKVYLRIGIHIGPLVAGVIGRQKFSYDVWGDTVNIASRMESHGITGEIQVSETVYWLLRSEFIFLYRGEIPVKGKSPMRTYLLKRSPLLA